MEIWQKLIKFKIFENLDKASIMALNFCLKSRYRIVEKNEIILSEGEKNEYCCLILSGKARNVRYDYKGEESIVKIYLPGELFGLIEAYSNTQNYLSSLVANEKTEILLFNRYRIVNLCENHCKRHQILIENLTKILTNSNLELSTKVNILSQRTIRDKVLNLLYYYKQDKNQAYFDIPFNRQEMANYLAVDRSALSIELSKMKKENIIDYNKNHFRIID